MEAYSVYIPMDRRQALSSGATLPDRTKGAALFADISGFTPLTEALVRELGPQRGAEELTRQLNLVYDALIQELHRYQGSVISFSGDAITCWFDEDVGVRAVTCALAMQEAMQYFSQVRVPSSHRNAPEMVVSLAMKAAVAVGPARRFVVGDPNIQWIDVLAGSTLDRLNETEHHANKGEVVIDQETADALEGNAQISEWRRHEETDECYGVVSMLESPATILGRRAFIQQTLTEDEVSSWVLPPVYERLRRGQGDFLAELRPAVSLFLRFGGIDYDNDDEAGDKLDEYIRWVQNELKAYDGYLLQLTVGDKGSYLMASLGAPVAHEDDAIRAVSAALKLIKAPKTLDCIWPIQIGISLGRTRAGAYGGFARRTYGVMGDDVNLAARLMQAAADGQILVSEGVYQATRGIFTWESLPKMKLKGKLEPVAVYQVIERQTRRTFRLQVPEYHLPMVGREAELAQCEAFLSESLKRQGRIIALVGDAGLGKTRLVAEIIQRVAERGLVGLGGECESFATETSYLVWRSIWSGFFDLETSWTPDEQIEAIRTQLEGIQPGLAQRLPLLDAVFNFHIPDNELTQAFDAKLRKTSLESLLVTCLQTRAQNTPFLIVLEDCQWIDPLSHELLEIIGRAVADLPVLIVVTMRPPELERLQVPRVNKLPKYTEVQIQPFRPEEAQELIQLKVQQLTESLNQFPEGLAKRIIARAEGNPFYIEEILNYLFDKEGGTESNQTLDLPTSLHSLILSRLDQLSENEKTVLKVASIIGRLFRVALLWGTYPELGDQSRVQSNLQTLQQMQITSSDPSEPELTYFFRQIVTQEVAYESLPFATRATLHGQLARYIEENYQQTVDQYIDLLAFHYLRGQVWEKSFQYNLLASKAAQREFANDAAVSAAERVLDSASHLEEVDTTEGQIAAHEIMGEVLTLVGKYDDALEHFATSREFIAAQDESPSQKMRLADLCCKIAEVYERRSEYEEAFEWLEKGLNYLDQDAPSIETARIFRLGAGIYERQGKNEDAIAWCQKSLDIASAIDTREGKQTLAHAHYLLGAIRYRLGDLRGAIHQCQTSVNIYQEIDDFVGEARAYNNMGAAFSDMGDWNQATEAYNKSLDFNQQIGNIQEQGFVANNLANINLYQGKWEHALELFRESNVIWKRLGALLPDAVTLSNLAQVYIYQENWVESYEALSRSQKIFEEIGVKGFLPELERRWGEYYLKTGELEKALQHTQTSLNLAESQEARLEEGVSSRMLGEVHMANRNFESARIAFDRSLTILTDLNSEYELAKTQLALVRLGLENGHHQGLREHLNEATRSLEKLGADVDLKKAVGLSKVLDNIAK
jgi:adenylate cyclase